MNKYRQLIDDIVSNNQCVAAQCIELDCVCRSCLIKIGIEDSFDIFSTWFMDDDDASERTTQNGIRILLEHVTSIVIDNESNDCPMPRRICKSCLDIAWKSFLFKNQAANADSALRKYIEQQRLSELLPADEFKLENIDDSIKSGREAGVVGLELQKIEGETRLRESSKEVSIKFNDIEFVNVPVHSLEGSSIRCEKSGELFGVTNDLKEHTEKIHPIDIRIKLPKNDRPYACNVCHKAFAHRQTLTRHAKLHEQISRNKQCSYCGKCFNRADDLRRHTRIHTGEFCR